MPRPHTEEISVLQIKNAAKLATLPVYNRLNGRRSITNENKPHVFPQSTTLFMNSLQKEMSERSSEQCQIDDSPNDQPRWYINRTHQPLRA